MIDFHSHILPGVDDGAEDVEMSLAMLRESFLQGVDAVVATSHFYADEESPEEFLRRRKHAYQKLDEAMLACPEVFPKVFPGAEVLYFPGISDAEGVRDLRIHPGRSILVEPPMAPWSNSMLDEIVELGKNLHCIPVIAHVDRYMRILRDDTLLDRVLAKKLLVQVNGTWFLSPETEKKAFKALKQGKIHLLGSDCHNMDTRAPNLSHVRKLVRKHHAEDAFKKLHYNAATLLTRREV